MEKRITAGTTDARFLASDKDIYGLEQAYQDYEKELTEKIERLKAESGRYHDAKFSLDKVGHDPYVLIAMASAIKPDFQLDDPDIQALLKELRQPRRQYTLTIGKVVADEYQAEYQGKSTDRLDDRFLDLSVKLTNYDLYCTVDSILDHDQLAHYAGYMRSHGSRPDLFPITGYPHASTLPTARHYQVPGELRRQYPLLDRMLKIGEPYIGYPYVWSGSDPETSFDCSGFIDFIMCHLGCCYRNQIEGRAVRLPVAGRQIGGIFYDGIYEKCRPIPPSEAQPGDLVFFTGTFDASYRQNNLSHVGIYVGDDTFLACGISAGVGYQRFDDQAGVGRTWRQLLSCYGRLVQES